MTPLILASTSPYRKELLLKLGLNFTVQRPNFDEDSAKKQDVSPERLCLHLGREKARSLANDKNCVIGSDQMLVLGKEIFGKPGSIAKAIEQLEKLQGRPHELLTSVSVYYQGQMSQFIHRCKMQMLPLERHQIEKYVELDQPLDCAGSYKIEKHGIALFEKIEADDFTAIQGLPLLELAKILRGYGFNPFNGDNQGSK